MNRTETTQKPYTQVINSLLNDKELSLKAKGLYAFMDSKPSGWNFTIASMSKQLKEGTDAIKHALQELKRSGYLEYTKYIDGSGKYTLTDGIAPKVENPRVENPKKGKSTRISNKEPIVKKITSYELFIQELKAKAGIPSKVTSTKKGLDFFNKIEDTDKLIADYVEYQNDKQEFAKRITDYMEDYVPVETGWSRYAR